jgi:phage tail-like protein
MTGFRYLNRERRWADFEWQGLERRPDGALELTALPLLLDEVPAEVAAARPPAAPAGLAVGRDGTIYFSDPDRGRVWRRDACSGTTTVLGCLHGLGTPRGLVAPRHRTSLVVVDAAHHRLISFDPDTGQALDAWGRPDPAAPPGRFDTPWTAAADEAGNLWVVDHGNRRVQKFRPSGDVEPEFWEAMGASGMVTQPIDVAVCAADDGTVLVHVLDAASRRVVVFDADGRPVGAAGAPGEWPLGKPMGLAAAPGAVWVGDNARRRVLAFTRRDGGLRFAGEAVGWEGPVAALAAGPDDTLLVYAGGGVPPFSLAARAGHRAAGALWSRAISPRDDAVAWHRLRADVEPLADGAHVELFVHVSDDPAEPPRDPGAPDPFPSPPWRRLDADVTDCFVGGPPARHLWVAARLTGDGRTSPVLAQMRVEFDRRSALENLPAIYRSAARSDFLLRFLALFESFFDEVETRLGEFPAVLDPAAVPAAALGWLAGWLGLVLDEEQDEAARRRAVAGAFAAHARRGTVAGLREALRVEAGVRATVEEPILHAAWWALPGGPEDSVLGFTTMLASAEAQGAVLGTTAVLDRSHLIAGEDFGAPLFEDVAHRLTVQVHRAELDRAGARAALRDVVEREKPAHTAWHLCVVEPRMRVGFQARIGVDTVVAGPAQPTALGDEDAGTDVVLGGAPSPRIGALRLGRGTRL